MFQVKEVLESRSIVVVVNDDKEILIKISDPPVTHKMFLGSYSSPQCQDNNKLRYNKVNCRFFFL